MPWDQVWKSPNSRLPPPTHRRRCITSHFSTRWGLKFYSQVLVQTKSPSKKINRQPLSISGCSHPRRFISICRASLIVNRPHPKNNRCPSLSGPPPTWIMSEIGSRSTWRALPPNRRKGSPSQWTWDSNRSTSRSSTRCILARNTPKRIQRILLRLKRGNSAQWSVSLGRRSINTPSFSTN